MKPNGGAMAPPLRRRWKWFAVAVLALVVFSLLVPFAFLLGRFPQGYLTDERADSDSSFGSYSEMSGKSEEHLPQHDESGIVGDFMRKQGSAQSQGTENNVSESDEKKEIQSHVTFHSEEFPNTPPVALKQLPPSSRKTGTSGGRVKDETSGERSASLETEKSCQLEFGSYCLWSIEHKVEMKDSVVKNLKDQLFVARAYYPSIAKMKSQEKLSREMKQNIQEHERMLSEAIADSDLPTFALQKIQRMEETIAKAKLFCVECNNVDKKLRQILDLTEEEAHFHMRQGAFLYHLGVQTMPKSHHCLLMRLTVEYFRSPSINTDIPHAEKLNNLALHHYVIFSRNILASSVTVNSTVMNAKESRNLVFHVLTDRQNYFAMKFWFSRNSYKEAIIHVLNIEDLDINNPYNLAPPHLSLSEEFRISIRNVDQPSAGLRTEYLSVFGHAHFLLPDMFKNLKKVIVLDDDLVVQQDLSPLWSLNLDGKAIAAVEFCRVRLGQLKKYLGGNSYKNDSCAWLSGLNIVDLEKWREHDISWKYQKILQEVPIHTEASWRAAALPTSYLAFQDLMHPLNESWVLSGLGKQFGVRKKTILNAAVLHFNGNMKPWLELGIRRYKKYWKKFLTRESRFMDECNVNP